MNLAHASPLRSFLAYPSARLLAPAALGPSSARTARTTTTRLQTRESQIPLSRKPFSTYIPSIFIRHASTASAEAAQSTAAAGATSASTSTLTWNEFLRLRRIRRFYNLGASIATSFSSLVVGSGLVLSQQNIQTMGQQLLGLDPFVIMGLCTTIFAAVGWLLGPLVGTAVFRLFNRKQAPQMAEKERDFFERIKKYRVDPSSSSIQNPVPDYYGEKITSVQGYRRWLKDQRAFNKKRHSFV